MIVFLVWFTANNIASTRSKTDILDGLTVVAVVTLYAALGVYSHVSNTNPYQQGFFVLLAGMTNALLFVVFVAAGRPTVCPPQVHRLDSASLEDGGQVERSHSRFCHDGSLHRRSQPPPRPLYVLQGASERHFNKQ